MNENELNDDTVTFEKNPYSPEIKKPEDIVRLFYIHNVPILPVISKRGFLFGILKKEDVIAELSDIARSLVKIDEFVQKLAKKMSMDELIPLVVNVKDLIAIDLFGEVQGRWSRLDLFMASEGHFERKETKDKKSHSQEKDTVIEWLIYLVLEHIPRALYALNSHGKTIFFNGHFEEIYYKAFQIQDIDINEVEEILQDSAINDVYTSYTYKRQYCFNRKLNAYYEKVPLKSENKTAGYLFIFDRDLNLQDVLIPDSISDKDGIQELLSKAERSILVKTLTHYEYDPVKTAVALGITLADVKKRMKKYTITVPSD